MDDDLCLSPMRGLSVLERRDDGLDARTCEGCSDSEELEAMEEELDIAGDMLWRMSEASPFVASMEMGSGYGFVAMVSK